MSVYAGFDVLIDNNDGTLTPVVGQTVHCFDVTNNVALAPTMPDGVTPLASDLSGHVAPGNLAVAAGTTVRFWVDLGNGRTGFNEVVTT